MIPFSNVTVNNGGSNNIDIKLHSHEALKYKPSTGSLSATKFVGSGTDLPGVIASAVTEETDSRKIKVSTMSTGPSEDYPNTDG